MSSIRIVAAFGLLVAFVQGAAGERAAAQSAPAQSSAAAGTSTSTLAVTGDVPRPLTLSLADLAGMPRATVDVESNGIATQYAGVWLSEALKRAGAPVGAALRGNALSSYVLASASDGYQVLFSLGELDPELAEGQFLIADTANGKPLFGENGSFRLVVAKDKRGARSVRMLSAIRVVQLRK